MSLQAQFACHAAKSAWPGLAVCLTCKFGGNSFCLWSAAIVCGTHGLWAATSGSQPNQQCCFLLSEGAAAWPFFNCLLWVPLCVAVPAFTMMEALRACQSCACIHLNAARFQHRPLPFPGDAWSGDIQPQVGRLRSL